MIVDQFASFNIHSANVSPAEFQMGFAEPHPRRSHGSFINNPKSFRNSSQNPFATKFKNQFFQRGLAASSISDVQKKDFRTCKVSGQKKTEYCLTCDYIHCKECARHLSQTKQCQTQEMQQDELAYLDMLGTDERKFLKRSFERLNRLDFNHLQSVKDQKKADVQNSLEELIESQQRMLSNMYLRRDCLYLSPLKSIIWHHGKE